MSHPKTAPYYLRQNLLSEPFRGVPWDYTLAVGVEVDVVDLVTEFIGAVVTAWVDGLVLDAEGKEAAGGRLHALDRAYPPVHYWALEDAAAVRPVAEVDLAGPVLEDSLPADAPDLDKLVHLQGDPITDAAVAARSAPPVGYFTPGYERLVPHSSLKPM